MHVTFFWKMLAGQWALKIPVSISPVLGLQACTSHLASISLGPTPELNLGPLGYKANILLFDLSPKPCLACDSLFQSVL